VQDHLRRHRAKIHRQEVNRLSDLLLPITQRVANEPGCHRILITIPNRLGKSTQELSGIASVVASAVQQKASASSDLATVGYAFDGTDPWPEPDDPNVLSFFEKGLGCKTPISCFTADAIFPWSLS
jgi:hypothetical protein